MKEYKFLITIFSGWILFLFIILFFAVKFIPVQKNFLGGGYANYIGNPYFWSLGNFDGEHYVSIARNGYGFGERAFFPLFPVFIKFFANMFGGSQISYYACGILISLTASFIGILGFYKLLRLDFSERSSKLSVFLLLIFPTSFYFAAVYTESLFFMLLVWSLYYARKGEFFKSTIFAILLTATRFIGLIVLPAILVEWFLQNKNKKNLFNNFPWITIFAPLGLLGYMYYLERTVHDMFAFFNNLASFGEQRSTHLIVLPQVFYRYVVKIIPNLQTNFFPVLFTTFFELFVGILYLGLSVWSFFKLRFSYAVILSLGYLIPTFSGSFSSLPRYVLVLFPTYILFEALIYKSKFYLFAFTIISSILLIISFTFFVRGYWIS